MTKDQEYWNGRFSDLEASTHRKAEEYTDQLDGVYREAMKSIKASLNEWYLRYAINNGGKMTLAEARRQLSSTERKEFRWTVQEYIKHGQENGISADWSKELENASARFHVTRLQALQLELQNAVEVLYGNQTDGLDRLLKEQALERYWHTCFEIQKGTGVGWDIAGINKTALETILKKPWAADGRNFSDRIWENKEKLVGELQKSLMQSLIMGRAYEEVAKIFAKRMDVSEHNAARIIRTESAYAASVAQEKAFKELDVEKFIFVATLDDRTSDICQEMDGQVFDMKDYEIGTSVPPLHPNCRSCISPYREALAHIGTRAAKDPETGKTVQVPKDMTYRQWEKQFAKD